MWTPKVMQMNLFIAQKQTLILKRWACGRQGGKIWEGWTGRSWLAYAHLYNVKQIINKDLLYSTGNSTQYSVMTYVGKESEKE